MVSARENTIKKKKTNERKGEKRWLREKRGSRLREPVLWHRKERGGLLLMSGRKWGPDRKRERKRPESKGKHPSLLQKGEKGKMWGP